MPNDFRGINLSIVDVSALVNSRQKTIGPQSRTDHRLARTQHDKSRQILVLGAQSIGQPRTQRRTDRLLITGVHHEQAGFMIRSARVHRTHDTNIVNAFANVRIQFADFNATLSHRLEGER